MKKTRICPTCGEGEIRPTTGPGRTALFHRLEVPIPNDFVTRSCSVCGESLTNLSEAKALDAVLAKVVTEAIETALIALEAKFQQKTIESALRLSPGYVSKLKRGERTPSPTILRNLLLASRRPDFLEEMSKINEIDYLKAPSAGPEDKPL